MGSKDVDAFLFLLDEAFQASVGRCAQVVEPVTDAQAAEFGAVAGEPADPCSHRACDTLDNIDLETLEQMADAIATVLVTLTGAH